MSLPPGSCNHPGGFELDSLRSSVVERTLTRILGVSTNSEHWPEPSEWASASVGECLENLGGHQSPTKYFDPASNPGSDPSVVGLALTRLLRAPSYTDLRPGASNSLSGSEGSSLD